MEPREGSMRESLEGHTRRAVEVKILCFTLKLVLHILLDIQINRIQVIRLRASESPCATISKGKKENRLFCLVAPQTFCSRNADTQYVAKYGIFFFFLVLYSKISFPLEISMLFLAYPRCIYSHYTFYL